MKPKERARKFVLEKAAEDLVAIAKDSYFTQAEPVAQIPLPGWPAVERLPGWPPELYKITYTCKGIAKVTDNQYPVYSDVHQFGMYLTRDFPASEPKMAWITDIWHPNIDHAGNRHICTNAPETHAALRPLSDLVTFIGEMVQYKRYFAKHEPPWPLDTVVAKWVREFAEPRELVGPNRAVDSRPFIRPAVIRPAGIGNGGAEGTADNQKKLSFRLLQRPATNKIRWVSKETDSKY
jgi:ubiquitin-protein ligase